jgi:hypothetical protein
MLLSPEYSRPEPTTFGGSSTPSEMRFETSSTASQTLEQVTPYASRQIPIRGGSAYLELIKPLSLRVVAEPLSVTVIDWDIRIIPAATDLAADLSELIESIEQQVARTFLQLASKAVRGALSEREEAVWLRISEYVDYGRYCEVNAAPLYMEGTVTWKGGKLKVRLDNEVVCTPRDARVAAQFSDFKSNERFGGYLLMNSQNEIVSAHGLDFVSPPSAEALRALATWQPTRKQT